MKDYEPSKDCMYTQPSMYAKRVREELAGFNRQYGFSRDQHSVESSMKGEKSNGQKGA